MPGLPMREMVLYKHGVGFFVRAGKMSGEGADLTFREDEINDILKSLAIFDQGGGQVLGIDYQTPMDKEHRLASSSIRLSELGSQSDLLRDLRGREVTLTVEIAPGTVDAVTGRVIGIDVPKQGAQQQLDTADLRRLAVAIEGDEVCFYPLEALRSLRIHDQQSAQDLTYFLDTSMREDTRRTIHVRLSEGEHDLVVYYVAPSPTWRVSYRVVAESDEGGDSGKALLQGWGLFDNRLEEDLEDVDVTLVAGQPISFIYDLYASHIPQRPTVKDESRIAPGPIEFAGAVEELYEESRVLGAAAPMAMRKMAVGDATAGRSGLAKRARMDIPKPAALADSTAPAAEGQEAGEFFQYHVAAPVSVRRGESALVPIINAEVGYTRELLYNPGKLPNHPVAALRFRNHTGLTLERGPVTLVEDGDYKGEAVIPFTKEDIEVFLPYAVELGVKITDDTKSTTTTTGLSFKGKFLVYEVYEIWQTEHRIENTTGDELLLTIEAPRQGSEYELFDTPAPDVETNTERRWRVDVPARVRTSFVWQIRRRAQRREQLRGLQYEQLQRFLKHRWLDQATFDLLGEMLGQLRIIEDMQRELTEITTEREEIYKQQEQLRQNLAALQPTGKEAALRGRILDKLEESQNRLDANETREAELKRQMAKAEAQIQQIIASLPQEESQA
ncbi:MAG: hypothetical protein JXB30_12085 [Anaerolineae bacterium]|nr:hypothetical protein [Anaerolineae bacterium]